jgi:hypothetical protein
MAHGSGCGCCRSGMWWASPASTPRAVAREAGGRWCIPAIICSPLPHHLPIQLLAPAIHPTSSCSWGWGQVLCRCCVIIPPLIIVWPPVHPPSTQRAVARQHGGGCSIDRCRSCPRPRLRFPAICCPCLPVVCCSCLPVVCCPHLPIVCCPHLPVSPSFVVPISRLPIVCCPCLPIICCPCHLSPIPCRLSSHPRHTPQAMAC